MALHNLVDNDLSYTEVLCLHLQYKNLQIKHVESFETDIY